MLVLGHLHPKNVIFSEKKVIRANFKSCKDYIFWAKITFWAKMTYFAGAEPGLVIGGGTHPLGWGVPTQYIYTFSEKPHEIKEMLVRRGGRTP